MPFVRSKADAEWLKERFGDRIDVFDSTAFGGVIEVVSWSVGISDFIAGMYAERDRASNQQGERHGN